MHLIKKIVKKLKFIFDFLVISSLKGKNKFSYIYKNSYWQNKIDGSKSGSGSNNSSTKSISYELNKFIYEKKIKSILDIPCGDWNWMRNINLDNILYLGCDIVDEVISENKKNYSKKNIKFETKDILSDKLPDADLIIVRDLLVHLGDKDILSFINNIKKARFNYLAITSYDHTLKNSKGTLDDNWRPLNLTIEPFNLREPDLKIDDSCNDTEDEKFKKLYVWKKYIN